MEPPRKRDPETEELEDVDDSDVELIDEEPSERDTIPPEGPIITAKSIPPGDPDIEQILLEESVDAWFDAARMPDEPEDIDEDEVAFERMLEEQAKKKAQKT